MKQLSDFLNFKNQTLNLHKFAKTLPLLNFSVQIFSILFLLLIHYSLKTLSTSFKIISLAMLNFNDKDIWDKTPNMFQLKDNFPTFFIVITLTISFIGVVSNYYYCLILNQRFSVPELLSFKLILNLMFINGFLIYLCFFVFGSDFSLIVDIIHFIFNSQNILNKLSSNTFNETVFIIYLLLNIIFSLISTEVMNNFPNSSNMKNNNQNQQNNFKYLPNQEESLVFKLKIEINYYIDKISKNIVGFSKLFINFLLIGGGLYFFFSSFKKDNLIDNDNTVLVYVLYGLSSCLQLTYYYDLCKATNNLQSFVDKEYFVDELE